jgi:hypothetical protein
MLASVAAVGACVCVSTASLAQEPPPSAPPPPAEARHGSWAEHGRERAEARARALHDILNIRPDQDAAFQAFIAAMKPPAGHEGMPDHPDMDEMDHLTTPERLDRMAARMADHEAEFQRRAAAVKAFYAALTSNQQRAFDALPGMMGMGDHGGEDHGGPDHGGPDRDGPPHPEG